MFCYPAKRRVAGAMSVLLLGACASAGAGEPASAAASPALDLAGRRVLVLPVQTVAGVAPEEGERATAELLFALGEHDARVSWIPPADLERALRRTPAYAGDPGQLPADPLLHHGERYAVDPLASELRRYAALMDTRLILLPGALRLTPSADGVSTLRLDAALLDARTGEVLWWGGGEGDGRVFDHQMLAVAAATLARRMIASPVRETGR